MDININNQRAMDELKFQSDDDQSTYSIEEAVEHSGFGWFQVKLLILVGTIYAADAMEMMLLSILGPTLQCEWNLTSEMKAMITTIVFIGFLFGSLFWGMVSDNYGRKPTFVIVTCLMSYMGFLTAFSSTYIWIIILRSLVGFSIGGAASSFTLLTEFLPSKVRAKILILFQVWWSCGSTFEIGLAYFILPRYGWRWVVALSAIPLFICTILIQLLPESPRFLLGVGKVKESQKIINDMFKVNKVPMMKGRLMTNTYVKSGFQVKNLLLAEYRCTLLSLLVIWFGVTFCYYGNILISSEYRNLRQGCFQAFNIGNDANENNTKSTDTSCCQTLSDGDYKSMIVSSFGEFFVIPINIVLIDFIGRRKTLGLWNLCMSFVFLSLCMCMSQTWTTVLIFGIRGFSSGLFNLTYIYTSEVFPTTVRSSATGICSSFARIAAIITPFVAQVIMPKNLLGGLTVYFGVSFSCFICSICLPIETKGRPMPQHFKEMEVTQKDH